MIIRMVAPIKSLRFALLFQMCEFNIGIDIVSIEVSITLEWMPEDLTDSK